MDAHTDTVGVGDPKEWAWDPYKGKVEDGFIYGRGACDQRAGMASMVYAGKIIKELGLVGDYTLWVVGSVQEEDCDGLAWLYILKEDGIRPDCVVITEPTNLQDLSRASRAHGDRGAPARAFVPCQRAGARRQSDLQDRPADRGDRGAEHALAATMRFSARARSR